MPQGDEEASEVEKSLKDGQDAVVAYLNAAEVLQPGVGSFDFPALAVSAQLSFVLETSISDVFAVGDDEFRAPAFQPHSQRIGVIASIGNDPPEMGTRS